MANRSFQHLRNLPPDVPIEQVREWVRTARSNGRFRRWVSVWLGRVV